MIDFTYIELEKRANDLYCKGDLSQAKKLYKKMIEKAFCQSQLDFCEDMLRVINFEETEHPEEEMKLRKAFNKIINEPKNDEEIC
jgi:hypothetical protein